MDEAQLQARSDVDESEVIKARANQWQELRTTLSQLFGETNHAYALPYELIAALQEGQNPLLTPEHVAVETALTSFCHQSNAVGIVHGKPVTSIFLDPPPAVAISPEEFETLGWNEVSDYATFSRNLGEAFDRAEPFRQQATAYIGWLITNPIFLSEVNELRGTLNLGDLLPHVRSDVPEYDAFCARWQLSGMTTWDLPIPLGVNMTQAKLPASIPAQDAGVRLSIPLTSRLPARWEIRALITEIRNTKSPPPLREWQQILDQEGKQRFGVARFADILRLHFYRNIVLASRYESRLRGRAEWLDRVFAKFLGDGKEDSVKKLRLAINKRLSRKPAEQGGKDFAQVPSQ